MPRKPAAPAYGEPVAAMMASLLPVHAASTTAWLVDAACTAAEQGLHAPFTFVFFEEQDGRLDPQAPASDLRRRSLQRVSDAIGHDLLRAKLDPQQSPAIAEALDLATSVQTTPEAFFEPLAGAERARAAQTKLGVSAASVAPLIVAGERIGALVVLMQSEADANHVRLLADHIATASANLRQATAARDAGVIDVVRSVFDARKLETELERELSRAERYKHQASIVVIEATNLRLLREQFGRFLTDRLLQRLGESLAQHARDIDVIGAYKESGYTMILTEATPEGAAQASRRLLEAASATRLDESVPGLELHLAVGYATTPADGASSDSLFAAVERRMYGSSQVA